MRRLLFPVLLLTLACRTLVPSTGNATATFPETRSMLPKSTVTPTLQHVVETLTPLPDQVPTDSPITTAVSTNLQPEDFIVQFHPDGQLFAGDLVSLEIIPDPDIDLERQNIQVEVVDAFGGEPLTAYFTDYGIKGRSQATFLWFWDTSGLNEGAYTIHFSLQPDNLEWTQSVNLSSPADIPAPEPDATWKTAESDCCLVHYITDTAAERDLLYLLNMVDEQTQLASQQMGTSLGSKIDITLLPRVWGHGGFANQEVSISYLDRNYAGGSQEIILHHELIHILDGRIGGDFRPIMLIEGVAVYLTGGHFKPEVLMPRAAALLPPQPGCVPVEAYRENGFSDENVPICGLNWYITLDELMEDFYTKQHEIGYLIAGSLVEYMVDLWGWEAVSIFYRDIEATEEIQAGRDRDLSKNKMDVDSVLERHFGITLKQLEENYLTALKEEPLTPQLLDDVRLTVAYYDTVRRYQELLDPSAYFATAWTPGNDQMRQRGIVADFLRRPTRMENLVMELMLVSANRDLRNGEYISLEKTLRAVNSVLDAVVAETKYPLRAHELARSYADLVMAAQIAGYHPQSVRVDTEKARVWANTTGPELIVLDFSRTLEADWRLMTVVE